MIYATDWYQMVLNIFIIKLKTNKCASGLDKITTKHCLDFLMSIKVKYAKRYQKIKKLK